jgi:hypothetical protein
MKVVKKYGMGGAVPNGKKTYTERIEALKLKIKEEKDPLKKAAMMVSLKKLREEAALEAAQIQMDSIKEHNAHLAEVKGDKGRAQRIRSSKQTQGVGEIGRDEKGSLLPTAVRKNRNSRTSN